MKIAIIASGTRGDVQPYVALGKGLNAAGHEVRVLTSSDFDSLVTGAGLQFGSVGPSIESLLQSEEWRSTIESGNFLKILARMTAEMKARAHEFVRRAPSFLEGMDLVVAGLAGLGGGFSVAEKLGIPVIQAYVYPLTPTRAFGSPLTTRLPFGKLLNRSSFYATQQMFWQSTRVADVATRRELGMPRTSFFGPFRSLNQKRVPVLYGYSPHVLPRPDDWDARHHVTGY